MAYPAVGAAAAPRSFLQVAATEEVAPPLRVVQIDPNSALELTVMLC